MERQRRGVAQFGRVLGLGPRCRRFEPCHLDQHVVAQTSSRIKLKVSLFPLCSRFLFPGPHGYPHQVAPGDKSRTKFSENYFPLCSRFMFPSSHGYLCQVAPGGKSHLKFRCGLFIFIHTSLPSGPY